MIPEEKLLDKAQHKSLYDTGRIIAGQSTTQESYDTGKRVAG
jgi:hypothetical protein